MKYLAVAPCQASGVGEDRQAVTREGPGGRASEGRDAFKELDFRLCFPLVERVLPQRDLQCREPC